MTENFLDISKKIDAETVSLYRDYCAVAQDWTWFVIGATARDIFLHYGFGVPVVRATSDVDLGVQVKSWEEFADLKESLLATGQFLVSELEHRLYHHTKLPLDLVPFGKIASSSDTISWPGKDKLEMTVIGYEDALKGTQIVRLSIEPVLDVPVAMPPAVTILKLISWSENPIVRTRDAEDIAYILINYLDVGNWERLEKADSDLTQVSNFDTVLAGAEMLGRDVLKLASPKTLEAVHKVLKTEMDLESRSRLAQSMSRTCRFSQHDPIALLNGFMRGMKGRTQRQTLKRKR